MSKDTGGPAFPHWDEDQSCWHIGLTMRDYFAAKAMATLVANVVPPYVSARYKSDAHAVAAISYNMADAMLEARNK